MSSDGQYTEVSFSDKTEISDGLTEIVVDFGLLGRLPGGEDTVCSKPDTPLPDGSPGCLAPSSQAVLRYWSVRSGQC